ncbi:MAG: polysaccharide biosynthesis C-terminal domain-containing protein [Candidatus Anstonellaceae archaeon]
MEKQLIVIFDLISGFLIKFFSFIISKLGGLIFYLLILNILDKHSADLFFEINALILLLAPITSAGLIYSVIKSFPIYHLKKDYKKMLDSIYSSIILFILFSIILFFSLELFLPQRLAPFFLYIFFGSFVVLLSVFFNNILVSLKRFNESLFLDISLQISKIFLLLFFLFFLFKNTALALLSSLLGYIVQILFAVFFVFRFLYKKVSFSLSAFFPRFDTIKDNITFGFAFFFNSLIEAILTQIDILIISYFLADQPGAIAGYALISLIVKNISPVILTPLYQSQQIILIEEKEKKSAMVDKIVSNMTRWSFYLGLVVLGFFVIFGKYFLFVVANQYYYLAHLFFFFIPFVIFDLLSASTKMFLFAEGKSKLLLFISLFILVSNITFDFLLIPIYGLVGAAAGTSLSVFFGSLLIFYFSKKNLSLIFDKKIIVGLVSFVLSCILTILLLDFLYSLKLEKIIFAAFLVILAGFFVFFYFLLLFVFRGFIKQDFLVILNFLKENSTGGFRVLKPLEKLLEFLLKNYS